jgi:hypothetical protein
MVWYLYGMGAEWCGICMVWELYDVAIWYGSCMVWHLHGMVAVWYGICMVWELYAIIMKSWATPC